MFQGMKLGIYVHTNTMLSLENMSSYSICNAIKPNAAMQGQTIRFEHT